MNCIDIYTETGPSNQSLSSIEAFEAYKPNLFYGIFVNLLTTTEPLKIEVIKWWLDSSIFRFLQFLFLKLTNQVSSVKIMKHFSISNKIMEKASSSGIILLNYLHIL